MSAPPPPRAIIFDWDNTLVDSFPVIHRALNETLVAFGERPWTYAETRARVARSLRESFPDLFGARWPEAAAVFYRAYEACHLDQVRPLPGAETVLEAARVVPLFVLSNKRGEILRREARHLGWDHRFQRLVGAGDARRDKPAPEAVAHTLAGSGIEAGREVWFVGDNAIDVVCAEAAGCTAMVVGGGVVTGEGAGLEGVRWRFDDCDALAALVRSHHDTMYGQEYGGGSG